PDAEQSVSLIDLDRFGSATEEIFVDREVIAYAVALADAPRNPREYRLDELQSLIEYGASPRGPIGLVQSARALALLRGRRHAVVDDVRALAYDVLRHRLVLSYEALAEGVTADDLLARVLTAVRPPVVRRRPTEENVA